MPNAAPRVFAGLRLAFPRFASIPNVPKSLSIHSLFLTARACVPLLLTVAAHCSPRLATGHRQQSMLGTA